MRGRMLPARPAALAALALLAAAPWAGARAPDAAAVDELLRSARLWQTLGHPQTERTVLRKLLAVQADEPRALFLLGQLELRVGNVEAARRALARLRPGTAPSGARVGSAPLYAELQALERIYTQQKARLAELRLVVRGGNQARALVLARALFPDGRPPGDLANEFAAVLSATPGGWDAMRAYLEERIAAEPTALDRLTLAELLAQHADTRDAAFAEFAALARAHDVEPERVAQAWRRALLALAEDDAGLVQRRRFLARFPADREVVAQMARTEAARSAMPQRADDPGTLARQRAVQALDAGDMATAEAELQRSRELRPDDGETLGTLGLLRLRQGRYDEALANFDAALALERAQPALAARWRDLARTARYWGALQQARTLRDGGDLDGAVRRVESVRELQPDQTEATALLAALRAAQGRDAEAERLYRELLRRDRGDARAWRGLLSLRLRRGQVEEALDEAEQLLLRVNVAPAQALDAGELRDAIRRTAGGAAPAHPDSALRLLERSVALLPSEAWLRYDLARTYLRLHRPALARQVMDEGVAQAAVPGTAPPDAAALRYAAALVDAALDREDDALARLDAIAPAEQGDGMRSLAQRMRFERALRLARAARDADRSAEDAHWREEALIEAGADPDRRLRVARSDLSADDTAAALALLDALSDPAVLLTDAQRRDLARLRIDAGQPERALALIDAMQAPAVPPGSAAPSADVDAPAELALLRARAHRAQRDAAASAQDRQTLAKVLAPADVARRVEAAQILDADRGAAQAWMDQLLQEHPQDPQVLLEAARQARRDGRYDLAVQYLRQVEQLEPGTQDVGAASDALAAVLAPDDPRARAQRQLAQIEARRQPRLETGWLYYGRGATDGSSTLRGTEIPLVAVWPGGYDGHWFAQLDAVRLDAGTLPAPLSSSGQFGKVQAYSASLTPFGLAQAVDEKAHGFSAAAGWRGEDRRFDLGVVGAGFKAPSVVGGWREGASWRDIDVSAELSRRIVTGSLLSYAGAADPVTGEVWGGVTNTALALRAGRDFARGWSGSTSLSLGVLTGCNVRANPNVESRTVFERDWIRRSDFRLSAGGLLNLWHYQSNESFYTFGQGGYYSPQRYVSVGVPVEVEGRAGLWSYDLRVTPSRSWTYEQNTPYYPTDARLQAMAGDPVHVAGPGGGLAGSVRGDIEYRVRDHWSVGGWLDIDRSAYYAPTRVMLYLRYWFSPQQGPVAFPPHPVVPVSLY
jgi:tetratricopeptide (TPR) repeat protein